MEHALHLILLLVLTRLGGALFEKAGQPASMGEIAAGIVLLPLAALPFVPPVRFDLSKTGMCGSI